MGAMGDLPIYKFVNRQWKKLPEEGDDVTIKDPKLKQGYLGDLRKKSQIELEEILKRNEQILSNKSLVSKLKDKGKSLQARQAEITEVLEEIREKENLHKRVPDQNDIHGFEWTGSLTNNTTKENRKKKDDFLEDGDDLHPLELMAHHASCVDHRETGGSRISEDDPATLIAKELEQMEIRDSELEGNPHKELQFGEKRNEMLQRKFEQNGPAKSTFKPYRPLSNFKPVPGLVKPEPVVVKVKPVENKSAICISQEESQKLEKSYLDKQKERDLKLTIEGLARASKVSGISQLPANPLGNYRDTNVTKHILDSDEEEEDDFTLGNYDDTEDDSM